MTVDLALTPDGRWQVGTAELLRAAAESGFTAVGLAAARVGADTRTTYRAAGLRCHEMLALQVSDDEEATAAWAGRLAEAAGLVGAEWVLTVFRTGLAGSTAAVVRRAASILAEAGARMAVEFSPLGPVASIHDGLAVVEAAGHSRAGLMIDSWHFCTGAAEAGGGHAGARWDDLAGVPLERIAYVQFADGLPPVSTDMMSETMDRRALPGRGVFDLERFASTLLERGWEGTVSVEVLSAELRRMPVADAVRLAHQSTARFWS